MEGISLQYPVWYVALCLLIGLGYAVMLYFGEHRFREQSSWLRWLLGVFRFLVVSILAILLLSPFIKSILTDTQKPIVIFAQDVSSSIADHMEETKLDAYLNDVTEMFSDLKRDYDLRTYAFGSEVRAIDTFAFEDKITNIASLLQTVYDDYSNQNLGAVVLATDGIFNEGNSPLYLQSKINAPVFTIALGDTTAKKDVLLKRVFNNKIAYLGDRFSIQTDISAINLAGESTSLLLYEVRNGRQFKIQEVPIRIDRNDFFITEELIVTADKSGVQQYRLVLASLGEEYATENNRKNIYIDILDARQKVLLLSAIPHPDLGAIRQSLANNKNYEVEVAFIDNFTSNVLDFDFVVLNQIPTKTNNGAVVIDQIRKQNIPHLFIVGEQTNIRAFNQVQKLVEISTSSSSTNQVQPILERGFNAFTLSDKLTEFLPSLVPIQAPFGEFDVSPEGQVWMYQQIGKIDTEYPLWILGESDNNRVGVVMGEGIWRWRLFDFLQNQSHDLFDEIIGKTVQYLSIKEDKRKFRVNLNKAIFNDNEPIIFEAQLYNDNYELINDPDVSLSIIDPDQNKYDFNFGRSNRSYVLDAGIFPEGSYNYEASVLYNGKKLTFEGKFSVEPIQLEQFEQQADHRLLQLMSDAQGGKMIGPDDIQQLAAEMESMDALKPVLYQTIQTKPIIHLKWVFAILLTLLIVEWLLRRYFGGY